jgi:DNA-binding beta-propeller fold protein YncE
MAGPDSVRVSSLPIVAKIPIPGVPDWLAIGPDAVWISNAGKDNIARIDPDTNAIVATVAVGRSPCSGLAVGFGSVWVPSCTDGRIDRVDQAANRVTARIATAVADSEGGIAADASGVWMVADDLGTLVCVDPASNGILARIPTAPGSFVPAAGAERSGSHAPREICSAASTRKAAKSPRASTWDRRRDFSPCRTMRCGRSIREMARSRASILEPTSWLRRSIPAFLPVREAILRSARVSSGSPPRKSR